MQNTTAIKPVNVTNQHRNSDENEYYTPQNSLIGSISTLLLYEESANQLAKALVCEQKSKPKCTAGTEGDNASKDAEDSEYCIIKNEGEIHDGWLVVSDH